MRILYLLFIALLTATGIVAQQSAAYNPADQAKLEALPVSWQRYWNAHNMDSMGTMLTADVDFVNVAGGWTKGRLAAMEDHKAKHLGVRFKTSIWQTDSVAIKYVTGDLAILHIGWGISGDFEDEHTPRPPRHGIFTWLVSKQQNQWLLLAVHNTNIRETGSPAK